MGRAWDNELTADHFKLFSGWCTELRHMRFISIERLYPKNLYTNLSLHNLRDGSKEATCILTYLEDQITLKLIYGRCRLASITDTKVSKLKTPSRSLRSWPPKKQSRKFNAKSKNCFIENIPQQYYNRCSQLTKNDKSMLPTSSRNSGKLFNGSMETC